LSAKARAMPILWRWPTENSCGKRSSAGTQAHLEGEVADLAHSQELSRQLRAVVNDHELLTAESRFIPAVAKRRAGVHKLLMPLDSRFPRE
jgi:hypothetical protein